MDILKELIKLQDLDYRRFNGALVPGANLIGVRIPEVRRLAKKIRRQDEKTMNIFLDNLPHRYLEENHLHGFILEGEESLDSLIQKTEIFLPYIDNWQTCDSFLPKLFKQENDKIDKTIEKWLFSSHEFTSRYAMRLMIFRKDYNKNNIVNVIKAGENSAYYARMGAAWYLSMAAVCNPEQLILSFQENEVSTALRSATVRKIRESKRFTLDEKDFLSSQLG